MKILITADLHFRLHWFRWLIEQGANYDLICIAGDLLDMFKGEPRIEQAREVSRWIRELAKATCVAVCSGNHDNAGRQILADRAPVYEWFIALGTDLKIITDGATQVLDNLIVTTVPYHCSKEQKSVWLIEDIRFAGNEEINGWYFITFRRALIQVPAAKNLRPQKFSWLTDRTILFPGTVTDFRTLSETVGPGGSAE